MSDLKDAIELAARTHETHIRACADVLNQAVRDAREDGLTVRLSVPTNAHHHLYGLVSVGSIEIHMSLPPEGATS